MARLIYVTRTDCNFYVTTHNTHVIMFIYLMESLCADLDCELHIYDLVSFPEDICYRFYVIVHKTDLIVLIYLMLCL
jgi:hypothetical protein